MGTIVLGSIVRDGAHFAHRYMSQCAALRDALSGKGTLKVIVCEGDSRDRTRESFTHFARELGVDLTLLRKDTGGPRWPSCVDVRRFAQKASVDNVVMDAIPQDADYFIFCESDLVWTPEVMLKLVKHLEEDATPPRIAAVSPMVFTRENNHYDIWGLIGLDGRNWGSRPPYHSSAVNGGLVPVLTTGSCICMRGDLARIPSVRFTSDEEFHGLSHRIYEQNQGGIFVDTALRIIHP